MTTVIAITAARMQEIEDASVVDGEIVNGDLILTKHDGSQINAGSVIGPAGPAGPLAAIPGEIKLWPSATLPNISSYGRWTWANGGIFAIVDYPEAAANIDDVWNTAMGLAAPGAGNFRVPDLRGLIPAGLDAMPVASPRANRLSRGLNLGFKIGSEYHTLVTAEMPTSVVTTGGTTRPVGTGSNTLGGGSGAQHENMPPTILIPYIVKLDD